MGCCLLLTSCSEKASWFKNTETKGVVIDYTTKKPVADATVTLHKAVAGGNGGFIFSSSGKTESVMDTKTDNSGSYKIKYRAKKNFDYQLIATKENYFPSIDVIFDGSAQIISANDREKKINMFPKATLKIHVKNVSPFNQYDAIAIGASYKLGDEWVADGRNDERFYGKNIDEFYICIITGNVESKIQWIVTKNNITTSFNTMLYCPAFDTTNYYINY